MFDGVLFYLLYFFSIQSDNVKMIGDQQDAFLEFAESGFT